MTIKIKRIYEPVEKDDGFRILVDRLWPRGVSKEEAHIDLWLKEIAPSDTLRKWFNHDIKKWEEFQKRYNVELKAHSQEIAEIQSHTQKGTITFLFAAKDTDHNNAVVLKKYFTQ